MRSPTGNETVRAPPVAVLGLVFLTGCVGSDPNAALRGVGTALPARTAASPTRAGTTPLLAAHLEPVGSPMAAGAVAESTHPAEVTGGALSEIEARAAAEQRLQAARDQRFDTAVRRATNLVCSGCTSGAAASANQRVRRAQAVAPDDEAE